jgi:MarR family transcriptional regulator for hemolysin
VQWQALLAISRAGGEVTQRELADALDIGAPACVALVDRMERDGLVERAAVPGDRRRNALHTTASSRRLLARIEATAGVLRREILTGMTREEVDALQRLLTKAYARIEALKQ